MVVGKNFLKLLGLLALLACIGAAGCKAAAGLGIYWAHKLTFELYAFSGNINIRVGYGGY